MAYIKKKDKYCIKNEHNYWREFTKNYAACRWCGKVKDNK